MSFPRYPSYKDSGVEWLGQVPEHWEVNRIRRVISAPLSNGIFKKKEEFGEGVLLVNVFDIYRPDFKIAFNTLDRVRCEPDEVSTFKVAVGDLFFVRSSLKQEGIAAVAVAESCSETVVYECHLIRARPNSQVFDGRFGSYLLNSVVYRSTMVAKAKVTTMTTIDQEAILSTEIPIPPISDQRHIAAFLDRETAKIDALVEEQQRLVELLKEKRQAVISHAVTKGLKPDAPMKPSGVEWLGNVPAHWKVVQSRRLFRVRSERALESDRQLTASQKYGVIFQSDFVEAEGRRVVEVIKGVESLIHAEPNDFVISMRSFQGGIEWCRFRGSMSFHYVMLVPVKAVHEPFFAYLFKSPVYIQALRSTTDLIRDGQELRYSHFVQVDLPLVPMEEQAAIASFLDHETAKVDALAAEAQCAIDLLRERRTALIAGAVTGQIDVRSLAKRQAA